MSAVLLWVRSDLRRRWRAWVVLGLLAGLTMGLAVAGFAGARRTAVALPRYVAASHAVGFGVLANDPRFDAKERAAVARLPEVTQTYPFMVAFAGAIVSPRALAEGGGLLPITPPTAKALGGVIVRGRLPVAADEAEVDQNASHDLHLGIGSTIVFRQSISPAELAQFPPALLPNRTNLDFTARLRVVGIGKSVSDGDNWTVGSAFYAAHAAQLAGVTNLFVDLRGGESDLGRFQLDVHRITGLPINVEDFYSGEKKTANSMRLERGGLLLFALAVLIGGGALVGQALVRSVTGGVGDLSTWQAVGAGRSVMVRALVLPTVLTALVGVATTVVTAIALSPRFPIGLARRYDLDVGVHTDWLAIALGLGLLVVAVLASAWIAAEWRFVRGERVVAGRSSVGDWPARLGLPPALAIGSRLALEPGRGKRAVPVRSALTGAIVGVIGIVACFTFRAGITDAESNPARSGIVFDYQLINEIGVFSPAELTVATHDRSIADALEATWARNVLIDGKPTPTFGTSALVGNLKLVVLSGREPRGPDEIAIAPATMKHLGLAVGDRVKVGPAPGHAARVVGEALLPPTSHTDYDESAWMTLPGLRASLPPAAQMGADDLEDYVLLRWKAGTNVAAAEKGVQQSLQKVSPNCECDAGRQPLPSEISDLGRLRSLPFALGIFFALLAIATVAHALVTTVRRWRHDFAVLRAIGFTRRQSRGAIAWQSTMLAAAGVLVGLPLGVGIGRIVWRWLADSFPFVYAPPLAVVALVVVVPVAFIVANAVAAGPARSAARIRPAEVLRAE